MMKKKKILYWMLASILQISTILNLHVTVCYIFKILIRDH